MAHLGKKTLAALLNFAPDAMLSSNKAGRIVMANVQAGTLFGFRQKDLVGQMVSSLVGLDGATSQSTATGTGVRAEGHCRDGSTFEAEVSLTTTETDEGALVTFVIRDVSARIELEAQRVRVKSEAERVRLEALAELVKADAAKTEAEHVRLKAEAELVKADAAKTEAERVRLKAETERVNAESEKLQAERVRLEAEVDKSEAEREKAQAERVRLEAEVDRVKAEVEKTEAERVRLETEVEHERVQGQLHQSQRMESLGQLAGGVAHDFNNLLAVILNYASFVGEELTKAATKSGSEEWTEPLNDVKQIQMAAERAGQLTHQLLSFARREVVQARALSFNNAITNIETILRRTIGEQIDLTVELEGELPLVFADPGQIEQIILNLVINARDAMPLGGTLSIETMSREVTADEWSTFGAPGGTYVCFRVSDNGAGMSKEVRERAFEPFFTTKPRGEGSGLGLATVFGIVSQSGGFTRIYSDEGVGTAVTILLPVAVLDETPTRTDKSTAQASPVTGSETILVVDDEEALREVARRILSRSGYKVLTAASGDAAIEIALSHEGPIELLLTDVIMPDMQGPTVATEVRRLRPGIRVLFMSGHAQPVLEAESVIGTDFFLVEKPFDQTMLLEHVRKTLDTEQKGNQSTP